MSERVAQRNNGEIPGRYSSGVLRARQGATHRIGSRVPLPFDPGRLCWPLSSDPGNPMLVVWECTPVLQSQNFPPRPDAPQGPHRGPHAPPSRSPRRYALPVATTLRTDVVHVTCAPITFIACALARRVGGAPSPWVFGYHTWGGMGAI